jgi:hypothetical protein
MSDVIKFMEELGKNSDLRLDRIDFESLLTNDDFDPEVRKAILEKDSKALEMLLNARSKIVCMIVPAKEEDDDEEDNKDDDDNSKEEQQSAQRAKAC